jgi:hypothetical protein
LASIAVLLQGFGIALAQRIDGTTTSLVLALGGVVLLGARIRCFVPDLAGLMLLVLALLTARSSPSFTMTWPGWR